MAKTHEILVASISAAVLGIATIVVMLVLPFGVLGESWDLVMSGGPQFLVGAGAILVTAALGGPAACRALARNPHSSVPLAVAPVAFLAGVVSGCAANVMILGDGWPSMEDYFFKPAFWFCLVGLPCSIPFGFYFRRQLRKLARCRPA